MYTQDPEAVYAIIAICLGSMFLQSSVYTILRMIKGEKNCTKYHLTFNFNHRSYIQWNTLELTPENICFGCFGWQTFR